MALQTIQLSPKIHKGGGLLGKLIGGFLGLAAGALTGGIGAPAGAAVGGAISGAATGAGLGGLAGGLAGEAIDPSRVDERKALSPLENRAAIDPEVGIARLNEAKSALDALPGVMNPEDAEVAKGGMAMAMAKLEKQRDALRALGAAPDWRLALQNRKEEEVV